MEKPSKKQLRERIAFLEETQKKEFSIYREANIKKLKQELKEMKEEKSKINEFLSESNKIEGEFGEVAFEDSLKAWKWGVKQKEINLKTILGIHKRIMKRLNPRIAGKIREVNVWVGNHKGLNPEFLKEELKTLCNPQAYPSSNEEEIKAWHIRFEKIHFAEDGNGRTGRILMNIQRLRAGLNLLVIYDSEKQEYYKWFKQ